jgi:hypothetical protein
MKTRQVSVFLENSKGRLFDVCQTLGSHGINIRALNIAETKDFGIVRMVVSDTSKAIDALKKCGFTASETDVVAIEVADQPGGLASVLNVLDQNNLNVEYMYGFVERKAADKALMVFRFDDTEKAIQALLKNNVPLFKSSI